MTDDRELQYRGEPLLKDLLDDPVTHVIMAHDGVQRAELDALISDVQQRLEGQARD
jgi:hypothetical protein